MTGERPGAARTGGPASPAARPLQVESGASLLERHALLLLDLDGTVYVAPDPIPTAAPALAAARAAGARLLFLTNNALRTPGQTAELLGRLGVPATAEEIVTSAQAAAGLLAADLPPGSPVLVVGGEGLRQALTEVGLHPVDGADEHPVAVAQGYSPEVGWALLSEGALAVRAGARWVATNLDRTLPSPRGQMVGNGALVAAVHAATGADPEVAGKPERHLVDAALARVGAPAADPGALVVGDRLDTDIACANRAGLPSLLVLTGVSGVRDLLAATPEERPTFLGRDLTALQQRQPAVRLGEGAARCGPWQARVSGDRLVLDGPFEGSADRPVDSASSAGEPAAGQASDRQQGGGDGLDVVRAAAVAAWAAADAGAALALSEVTERLEQLGRLEPA